MVALDSDEQRILIERIRNFSKMLKDDIMSEIDVANMQSLKKSNIEKLIKGYHKYSIFQRKDGLVQTRVPSGSSISAKTIDDLYEKLFELYFGENFVPTLSSVFNEWMGEKEKFRSSETIKRNRCDWNKYIQGNPIAEQPIEEITASILISFYRNLVGDGNMKRRCFTNVKSVINETLDFAVERYSLATNPSRIVRTKDLNFASDTPKRQDYFSDKERRKMIEHLLQKPDEIYAMAIIVQFSLGCRIGELKALAWDDYDEEQSMIFIHKEVVKRKIGNKQRVPVILQHTKGKKEEANRELPVSKEAKWALQQAKKLRPNSELIFCNTIGDPLDEGRYNFWMKKYCQQIGINYHPSHDIRRYVISAELEAGMPDVIVQHNSGHLNFSTTLKYKRQVGYKKYNNEFLKVVSFDDTQRTQQND